MSNYALVGYCDAMIASLQVTGNERQSASPRKIQQGEIKILLLFFYFLLALFTFFIIILGRGTFMIFIYVIIFLIAGYVADIGLVTLHEL